MIPTPCIYSIQFEFWSLQQYPHLCLHLTCNLNNKSYSLTPALRWHQYLHLCVLYQLLDHATSTDKWLHHFYMLLFVGLHFPCTHFWQLVHCIYWINTNTSTTDTTWPSYSFLHYLLPFSTNHNLGFIHIYSLMPLFSTLSFRLLSLLIRSSSVSAITTKSSAYNNSNVR